MVDSEGDAEVAQARGGDNDMSDEAPAQAAVLAERPRRAAAKPVAAPAVVAVGEDEGEDSEEEEEFFDAIDDEDDDDNEEYLDAQDEEHDEEEERSRDDELLRLCGVSEVLRKQKERDLRDGDCNSKVLHYDGICNAATNSKVRNEFKQAFEGNAKICTYAHQNPAEPMSAEKAKASFTEYEKNSTGKKNLTGKYKWLSK